MRPPVLNVLGYMHAQVLVKGYGILWFATSPKTMALREEQTQLVRLPSGQCMVKISEACYGQTQWSQTTGTRAADKINIIMGTSPYMLKTLNVL